MNTTQLQIIMLIKRNETNLLSFSLTSHILVDLTHF